MTLHARKSVQLEDAGAQVLHQASNLWERYGRIVLIALGAVVVIGAATFFTLRARASAEEQAAGRLAQASIFYWQGEYDRSLEMAREVTQQYPSTPSGNDAHRLAGDNSYWLGDFKSAITEYRAYLERNKSGLLADAVRRSLAYALESDGQYAEAAKTYEGLVGAFDRESSAEFLVAAARCLRATGDTQHATELLQRTLREHGDSGYAPMARIELAEMGVRIR